MSQCILQIRLIVPKVSLKPSKQLTIHMVGIKENHSEDGIIQSYVQVHVRIHVHVHVYVHVHVHAHVYVHVQIDCT